MQHPEGEVLMSSSQFHFISQENRVSTKGIPDKRIHLFIFIMKMKVEDMFEINQCNQLTIFFSKF